MLQFWSITSILGMLEDDKLWRVILPGVTTLGKKSSKCAWHLALHSNAISEPLKYAFHWLNIKYRKEHAEFAAYVSFYIQNIGKGSPYWGQLIFSLFTCISAILSLWYWIWRKTWVTIYVFPSNYLFPHFPTLYLQLSPWEYHVNKVIRNKP